MWMRCYTQRGIVIKRQESLERIKHMKQKLRDVGLDPSRPTRAGRVYADRSIHNKKKHRVSIN